MIQLPWLFCLSRFHRSSYSCNFCRQIWHSKLYRKCEHRKNVWSCTFTPPAYLHSVDRSKFTWTLFRKRKSFLCLMKQTTSLPRHGILSISTWNQSTFSYLTSWKCVALLSTNKRIDIPRFSRISQQNFGVYFSLFPESQPHMLHCTVSTCKRNSLIDKVKVKQSRYKPGVAQRVPES
jgi:hypothetical protein